MRILAFLMSAALVLPVGPAAQTAARAAGPEMYPRGVGADLGPTPTTLGVDVRAGDDAAGLRTGTLDGRGYWQTQVAAGTSYLAVTPAADYVAGVSGRPTVVMVTYYDRGTGHLTLGTAGGTTSTVADLGGSDTWRSAAVDLAPGVLGELHLAGDAGDVTIGQVRITVPGPRADLGPAVRDTGLSPRAGDDPSGLVTGTADGRGYWQTSGPGTGFVYVDVSDAYAYDTTDIVLVSVDYFDAGDGRLFLHYDSPGDELIDKFKPSGALSYGDTQTWKTTDFVLDDAILTNRSNGADFRLTHEGSATELRVAAIQVTVIPRVLDVKAGLRDLVATAGLAKYAAREGVRDGQHPRGSIAAFGADIAAAQAVLDDGTATEAEVRAALTALYRADQAFLASAVDTDLARNAVLTASSGAAGLPWTSGNGGRGEWLRADLGSARPVNEVLVRWGAGYSPDYTVEVSRDGQAYRAVGHSGATGASSRTRFATTTARYVRLTLTGYAPGRTSFDVTGFEIRHQRDVQPRPELVRTKYPTADAVIADFRVGPHGAGDSTAAIQSALWDCYDAGGGTVWLPGGTYRVTATIEVPAFCTLRGDRRDPDQGHGDYGTVIVADLPSGDDGPVLFRIGGSAGVEGVTTWYPKQNAAAPVPYNYTFEITGSAWASDENYMMATVADVTMLNSYRGIGISTMRDERGRPPGVGQTHESATVRDVRGTVLLAGAVAYNGADVGTWDDIRFSNAYWTRAPAPYHPPARSTVDAWTRAHGTGFVLGDLEWDQFSGLSAADFQVGIHVVAGQRADFTGIFTGTRISRTGTALLVDQIDSRWGMAMAGGELDGAVTNNAAGYVKLAGTEVTGPVSGIVEQTDGPAPVAGPAPVSTRPARGVLYDGSAVPHGNGFVPARDATPAIQRLLDRAGRDGGGLVYLPAGWYRLAGRLAVPAGVELRGASPVPNRDEDGRSGGTVLMAYAGRNTTGPDTITLKDRSGLSGLRVFYPENNPAAAGGLVPYPYAVRGQGSGLYIVNVGLPNAWNGIDVSDANRFLVRKVDGTFVQHGIRAGGDGGLIDGVLSNGNTYVRTGFYPPDWVRGENLFPQVIDGYTRVSADLVTVEGGHVSLHDVFGYGQHNGLVVNGGEAYAVNLGTDNLGGDGYTVKVAAGRADVVNLMRYNGSTSIGAAQLTNVMVIP
ncbi:glycosyl hydrolase family 28-related protein [Actinoplanes sp. NPDC051411]|uniref:glycosyl hydrolase family 28-related protein n=1 Tax=Actinoplanes sp. NPDC051411 TaxID=3155522 RepID=UPI003443F743